MTVSGPPGGARRPLLFLPGFARAFLLVAAVAMPPAFALLGYGLKKIMNDDASARFCWTLAALFTLPALLAEVAAHRGLIRWFDAKAQEDAVLSEDGPARRVLGLAVWAALALIPAGLNESTQTAAWVGVALALVAVLALLVLTSRAARRDSERTGA